MKCTGLHLIVALILEGTEKRRRDDLDGALDPKRLRKEEVFGYLLPASSGAIRQFSKITR